MIGNRPPTSPPKSPPSEPPEEPERPPPPPPDPFYRPEYRPPGDKSAADYSRPMVAFCFSVEIPDLLDAPVGIFKSVSGLKAESEVIDFKEGGVNNTTLKMLGATKWPNLVLKRGFTGPPFSLMQWRWSWLQADVEKTRLNGTITQLSTKLEPMCRWTFHNAWPCKWEGPDYDAGKQEVAIESLELAHEGLAFEWVGPGFSLSLPFADPRKIATASKDPSGPAARIHRRR